ncbi:MAG: hypothetical protein WBB94_04755 [Candidatus Saccharimonadaceae bacterium]
MHDEDPFDDSVEPGDDNRHEHYRLGKNALSLAGLFDREISVSRHPASHAKKNLPLNGDEQLALTILMGTLTPDELAELNNLIVSQSEASERTVLEALRAYDIVKDLPPLDLE